MTELRPRPSTSGSAAKIRPRIRFTASRISHARTRVPNTCQPRPRTSSWLRPKDAITPDCSSTMTGTITAQMVGSQGLLVQSLEQVVGGQLDLLMPPLGRPVQAGDDAHPVDAPEIPVDKCVPGLGLVGGAVGEAEMPPGVFLPRVPLQVGVLVGGTGLDLPPVDRKSTRLNSSHPSISYAVFCLKKK